MSWNFSGCNIVHISSNFYLNLYVFKEKKIFFVCQITVKYTNVNIKNSEDPLSTHFFKIRLKAQPGFTRVKPMGKPGEIWALRTLRFDICWKAYSDMMMVDLIKLALCTESINL